MSRNNRTVMIKATKTRWAKAADGLALLYTYKTVRGTPDQYIVCPFDMSDLI